MKVLILAGGLGTRMRPLSFVVPKPLIAYNKKPILEHIIEQLFSQGINDIVISLGYGANLIEAYCNIKQWGVKLVTESNSLGTAGPIQLIDFDTPLIVMNGDIITNIQFRNLYNFHTKTKADITVVCKEMFFTPNFGLIQLEDNRVKRILERPTYSYLISCGIYVINPEMKMYIKECIDFPQLINKVLSYNHLVYAYMINEKDGESWIAIEEVSQLEKL